MKLDWQKCRSTLKPQAVVFEKTTVYLHKNIHEVNVEQEGMDPYIEYESDMAALAKAEYARYLAEKNKADIDYICMETGVEL